MEENKTPLDELYELSESVVGKKEEVYDEMNLYRSAINQSTERVNTALEKFEEERNKKSVGEYISDICIGTCICGAIVAIIWKIFK